MAVIAAAAVLVLAVTGSPASPQASAVEPDELTPLPVDYCYGQMMMPHHEQAVEMSDILLAKPGISERATEFARFVRLNQSAEVASVEA